MSQLRVGILRGGPSSEYEVSLLTGASILKALPEKYKKEDILITKDGVWHLRGIPIDPLNLANHLDVAATGFKQGIDDIQIHGLASCARFFGAVEDSDRFDTLRQ